MINLSIEGVLRDDITAVVISEDCKTFLLIYIDIAAATTTAGSGPHK